MKLLRNPSEDNESLKRLPDVFKVYEMCVHSLRHYEASEMSNRSILYRDLFRIIPITLNLYVRCVFLSGI